MSERRDGGPAFPMDFENIVSQRGMSTRTWLAGLAMQGLCSRKDYEGDAPIRVAMEAIEHADALLEELAK